MPISFSNSTEVFIFIILCSVYVCSILWIYGDAATRDMGIKGAILPLIFVIAAALALTKGLFLALLAWPIGYIAWFVLRPATAHVITE
ncbi:MAG: hypothetical protein HND53_02545 [Proteobacteria bacterium]|nr:hypothetical protein [Pseudomonadota bacterium]NOG59351.1 hypothetical protein [Pseudomonadota bacterium]